MSIDNDLNRIANAVEAIATALRVKVMMPMAEGSVPASDGPSFSGPGTTAGPKMVTPLTPQALKLHAIEMSKNMTPEETKNFTAYVRGFVCSRFGVQKLVDVPADQVEYAMGELKAFDKTQDYSPKKGN